MVAALAAACTGSLLLLDRVPAPSNVPARVRAHTVRTEPAISMACACFVARGCDRMRCIVIIAFPARCFTIAGSSSSTTEKGISSNPPTPPTRGGTWCDTSATTASSPHCRRRYEAVIRVQVSLGRAEVGYTAASNQAGRAGCNVTDVRGNRVRRRGGIGRVVNSIVVLGVVAT